MIGVWVGRSAAVPVSVRYFRESACHTRRPAVPPRLAEAFPIGELTVGDTNHPAAAATAPPPQRRPIAPGHRRKFRRISGRRHRETKLGRRGSITLCKTHVAAGTAWQMLHGNAKTGRARRRLAFAASRRRRAGLLAAYGGVTAGVRGAWPPPAPAHPQSIYRERPHRELAIVNEPAEKRRADRRPCCNTGPAARADSPTDQRQMSLISVSARRTASPSALYVDKAALQL